MKSRVILGIGAAFFAFQTATTAYASNCGVDFQHAYETGVNDGRVDGGNHREKDVHRHRPHLKPDSERGACYKEGYKIGYANAAADAKGPPRHEGAPTPGSNERAYYDDGCHEGTADAKMSMSMAYERHADMYDSRFEPFFKDGYDKCWKHHR